MTTLKKWSRTLARSESWLGSQVLFLQGLVLDQLERCSKWVSGLTLYKKKSAYWYYMFLASRLLPSSDGPRWFKVTVDQHSARRPMPVSIPFSFQTAFLYMYVVNVNRQSFSPWKWYMIDMWSTYLAQSESLRKASFPKKNCAKASGQGVKQIQNNPFY